MNLRLKLSRQFPNRWIFFLQPFPYRGRILFIRAAHRLLWGQTPGAQIASHRPHRNLQIEFSRQQLLHRFSGPQRKGQAQLVWTTADNVPHRRGCLMWCQSRNRRPSATSCFQRPTSYAFHQPHPSAHRTSSYPEDSSHLSLRKTFLNCLNDSPPKVFLSFRRQRASILVSHARQTNTLFSDCHLYYAPISKTLPSTAPADVRDAMVYDLLYFSVAAKLFNPGFAVPEPVRKDAEAFVSRIQEAGGELPSAASSKFGDEDFAQYKVRGHYEKNKTLQRYFRGMMWFGRKNFLLSDRKMTLAAILIPGLLEKAQGMRTFESLDHSLGYIVGAQDKYTLAGYRSVSKKIFGTETPSANQLVVKLDENLQAFNRTVESDLPPPQIVSVQTGAGKKQSERLEMVRGFKFLGQRFTLDAYFLNQMTSPSVGSDDNPRNLPSTLDVMMLLGSKAATEEQQQIQQHQKWPNYESQAKKLEGVAQEHLAKQLTFYDEWLNALNSLFLPTASKQLFALGKPWQYKNL